MFWRECSSLPYELYGQDQVGIVCLHRPLGGIMAWLHALLASGRDYGGAVCLHEAQGGIGSVLSAFTSIWAGLWRGCMPYWRLGEIESWLPALRFGRAWCGHEMTA